MDWKILRSLTALKDRWINIRADKCQLPNGNVIDPYYVLQYPDYVNAVAITKEKQVIMNREYRHGIGKVLLELPSGTVDENETPLETVKRELLEETGYEFEIIIPTCTVSPNPANHSNLAHSFLAIGGVKTSEQKLDKNELIEVELLPLESFKNLLKNNELENAMHVSSAYYALEALKKLQL